jgi:hypothetical protein
MTAERPFVRWTVWGALVLFYAVLGLVILVPESVYSGDIGVKFVQARALAGHQFTSLAISYPGAFLDPERTFFPIRPPFVMTAGAETQAIFSPAAAIVQAAAVSVASIRGLVFISILSAAVILFAASALAPARDRVAVLVALGIGGPLWFFAVSGWEHAPAVAFGTAAFACAVKWRSPAAPWAAGFLLGAGATQRDEVVLLLPGLLLVLWLRSRTWLPPSGGRTWKPIAAAVASTVIALVIAGAVDLWWFHRPPAAHLRHAVHLLQSALRVTNEPNTDVPVLQRFTPRQRYETVVQYWLLGYGNNRWIVLFAGGLAAALAWRWWRQSSAGLLVWSCAVLALAAIDLREVATAPKWLAGMLRVSPFFIFALLPAPPGRPRRDWLHAAILCTAVIYMAIAYAGVDTTGGKGLGPRLLFPLFPLLCVTAVAAIREYAEADRTLDRWVGRVGVALVLVSIAIHVSGTIPAYVARNRDDGSVVSAVAASRERVVVADDVFTAQLMFPLYYRKIILLADNPELGARLGALLAEQHVMDAILVSRSAEPAVELHPMRLVSVEHKGRMVVEHWQR